MNRRPSTLTLYSLLICLFLIGFFGAAPARAEKVSAAEMEQACQNWLKYVVINSGSWAGSNSPQIINDKPIYSDEGILVGRCFNIDPVGFVVVPVLRELPPIKAYSDENNLDIDAHDGMAAMLREILNDKSKMYRDFYGSLDAKQPRQGKKLIDPDHRDQWDIFAQPTQDFNSTLEGNSSMRDVQSVGPLLTTTWHQGYPYNNFCPIGDGGRCVVGCVATASAQIMWYWQWPPFGEGSHSYYWSGDNSCDGSTPGQVLSADYSDAYEYTETTNNLAELCYEVGVAFNMQYGACGSGAYTADAQYVFPTYFRYRDNITVSYRSSFTSPQWFMIIQNDIDAGRPMQYRINLHSIVCDGWRVYSSLNQYHMNYGWDGDRNAWYTIDNLHCPWDGCSPTVEYVVRGIEPDQGVMLYADTTFGEAPMTVEFTGTSDEAVDDWIWDFGDGTADTGSALCVHEYDQAGMYDISLTAVIGSDSNSIIRDKYVVVLADTLKAPVMEAPPGETFELTISGNNTMPLSNIIIPIHYGGDFNMTRDSISVVGCRTDYFESVSISSDDPYNDQFTVSLTANSGGSAPNLEPGDGPLVKVWFTIDGGDLSGSNAIEMSGYFINKPIFTDGFVSYAPSLSSGIITAGVICGDANLDFGVDILDIVYLIEYKFKDGPAPEIMTISDVNHDTNVDILDIIYMIEYKFKDGPAPDCQ